MDAKAFCNFLHERLKETEKVLSERILRVLSQGTNEQLYRSAGARDIVLDILDKLGPLLNEFYKSNERAPVGGSTVGE